MVRLKTDPPRGLLITPAAGRGLFRHQRYHPSAGLDKYVEHYWVVEWDLRGEAPERAETLPHPSVHMVFEPDGKSRIRGPARAKFSRLLEDSSFVFAVKFTPGGFYPFVGEPVSKFSDTIVSLCDVFGRDGDELDRAVLAETSDLSRIEVIERFLRTRPAEPDEHFLQATEIVYAVASERGIVRVEDLSHRYGLSKRTLQRLFAKYVGVSPKWVIQRYRLNEAAEQLASGGGDTQAELALKLGYSDQAHFIRDFKAIVGVSPAAYARAARQNRARGDELGPMQ
jgi:AraC-like DNA-binding protein